MHAQSTASAEIPESEIARAIVPHPPLSKLQMLEEEFVALHGPLPDDHLADADTHRRYQRLVALLHRQQRRALCISGGGIRSATFALGVIQGLARRNALTEFDYLSTVSGGGYIGSWLSGWARRSPNGLADVSRELSKHHPAPSDTATPGRTVDHSADPHPVAHLRQFSNYLTPKLGLLSADTWTLAATYARNLVVNWLVFVPLLLAVLMIPRLCLPCTGYDTTGAWIVFMLVLGVGLVVTGLTVTGLSVPSVAFPKRALVPGSAEERARQAWLGQGGFLRGVFTPLSAAATCLTVAWAWYRSPSGFNGDMPPLWQFMAAGVATYFLTFLCTWLLGHRKSLDLNVRAYLRPGEFIIFPVVGALAGLLTYIEAAFFFPKPAEHPVAFVCLAGPTMLAIHFFAGTLYVALKSRTSDPRDDEDREWWARTAGWLVVAIVVWAVFSLIVLKGPGLLTPGFWATLVPVGAVSGVVTMLLSSNSSTPATKGADRPRDLRSMLTNAALALAAPTFIVFLIAALSLLTDVLLTGRLPTTPEAHRQILTDASMWIMVFWMLSLLAIGMTAAYFINLNKFSMHALYRNRIIRGYLGASRARNPNLFTGFDADDNLQMYNLRSRPAPGQPHLTAQHLADVPGLLTKLRDREHWLSARIWPLCTNTAAALERADENLHALTEALLKDLNALVINGGAHANPVAAGYLCDPSTDSNHLPRSVLDRAGPPQGPTSPGDPTAVERNRHLLEHVYEGHVLPGAQRPLHVVNIALNLVGGGQLAWQERKAESFTVSALHCGNHRLGYRRSLSYGGQDGISLGTAVAISGAAASPNSGYHSSPPLALLMTIFNVRLGWWLGNPADARASRASAPRLSVTPVVHEAFGLTNERSPNVYLSDGGHFENLALYEMVLRRCRTIVLSDGGCDPTCVFEDLGNAIRKIRVDLGIEITIDTSKLYSRDNKDCARGKYCAIGTIHYRDADHGEAQNGELLYIKPSIPGGEPADVRNYASTHELFPHEPTGDQWFSESQFESYRALGEHVVEQVWGSDQSPQSASANPADELVARAKLHVNREFSESHGRVQEFTAWAREYIDTHISHSTERPAPRAKPKPKDA